MQPAGIAILGAGIPFSSGLWEPAMALQRRESAGPQGFVARRGGGAGGAGGVGGVQVAESGPPWAQERGLGGQGKWRALRCEPGGLGDPRPLAR